MMLCGFGWRKASHTNAQSALSISSLRLLGMEETLMDMMMRTTTTTIKGMFTDETVDLCHFFFLLRCFEAVKTSAFLRARRVLIPMAISLLFSVVMTGK